jgi:hypothetical protein
MNIAETRFGSMTDVFLIFHVEDRGASGFRGDDRISIAICFLSRIPRYGLEMAEPENYTEEDSSHAVDFSKIMDLVQLFRATGDECHLNLREYTELRDDAALRHRLLENGLVDGV